MAAAAAAAGTTKDQLPTSRKEATTKPEPEEPGAIQLCVGFVFFVLSILGVVYLSIGAVHMFGGHWQRWFGPYDPVEYSVTIAAVSGLDPTNDLQQGPPPPAALGLDPAFNLTLSVVSPRTARRRVCMLAGNTVEVTYLRSGVLLATGPVPAFCVEVGEHREEGSIVAWGDGVRLPRLVLDTLAADMRRGSPEFGVKLIPPLPWFRSTTVDVISCKAKVGGGPAPCAVSRERVSFPPVPHPGVSWDSAANLVEPNSAGEHSDAI